jgi:DNA-binding transcriptional LysR family regulator
MLIQAVRAGIGLGLFACYLCDGDPGLVRLRTLNGLGFDLWILTHPDLRDTPRVRVLMDHLAAALVARQPALTGQMPAMDRQERGEGEWTGSAG